MVGLAGGEAVVELAEHAVEHLAQGGDVAVSGGSSCSVSLFPESVVADGGERPDIAGGGDAIVLGATGVDVSALPRCA